MREKYGLTSWAGTRARLRSKKVCTFSCLLLALRKLTSWFYPMGIGQTDGQSSDVPPSQYLSGLRKTHTGGMNLAKPSSSSSRNAAVLRRLGKGIVRRDVCIRVPYIPLITSTKCPSPVASLLSLPLSELYHDPGIVNHLFISQPTKPVHGNGVKRLAFRVHSKLGPIAATIP